MAKLNKLLIQGIRSFSPDDNKEQMITFSSPVTLILGQNGCGKTTIIESLKYAITGDIPSGSNLGRSFVHDPKIIRRPEVRGQIKLKLTDQRGESVVVTRTVQVTQKLKTVEFKTLDPVIQRKKPDGQIIQVGGRCVDVNLEMCNILGVSKAVLNFVIFCHQEDSNWPLEEGKKLKERFDAIFDATKLNNSLELILKMRKRFTDEIHHEEINLKTLLQIKEATDAKKDDLKDADSRMAVSQDQVNKLDKKLAPVQEKLSDIYAVESDYDNLNREQVKAQSVLHSLEKQQSELKKNIKNILQHETVDEINELIKGFRSHSQTWKQELLLAEKKVHQESKKLERLDEEMSQEQMNLGKMQKEEEDHIRSINSRNKVIVNLSQEFGLPVSNQNLDAEDGVSNFLHKINMKMKNANEDFEKLVRKFKSEENDMQCKVDAARDNKVKIEQEINMKRNQADNYQSEAWKVRTDLDEIDKSAGKLAALEKQLDQAKSRWESACKALNETECRSEIREIQEKCNMIDEQLNLVDEEVQNLQLLSSEQAQLDMQMKLKSETEAKAKKIRNKHIDTLRHLLQSVPQKNIKNALDGCLVKLGHQIIGINNKLTENQKEVASLEVKRSHKKDQLDNLEKELKRNEDSIYNLCGRNDFNEYVANVSDKVQELQDLRGTLTSSEYMFRRYIQKLEEKDPCCPLCHREFEDNSDAVELVTELNNKMREVPTRLVDSKKQLEIKLKEYDNLLQMKPTYERIDVLQKKEIPTVRKELQDIEINLDTTRNKVENLKSELIGPKTDEQMGRDIQSDIGFLDQSLADLSRIELEIEKLKAHMPSGSTRTLEEALDEQKQLRSEVSNLRSLLNSKQEKLRLYTEDINNLREHKNTLQEQKIKLESGQQKRKQLSERMDELEALQTLIMEEIRQSEEKFEEFKNDLDLITRDKENTVKRNHKNVEDERNKLLDLKRRIDEMNNCHKQILSYGNSGAGDKLHSLRQRLVELDSDRESSANKIKALNEQINLTKEKILNQQIEERELEDNKLLKEKQSESAELKKKIDEIKTRIGSFRFKNIEIEKKQLLKEEAEIKEEKSQFEGRIKELKEVLTSLHRDLNLDMYKNADKYYIKSFREVEVKKIVVSDLQKYYQALDWSLISLHKERMKKINMIIRELWRKIYRGNDIDFIEIKTDSAEPSGTASLKKRNYNYKVVQVKHDCEIEMRGRCSAGQKVLASLVIRIALAEILSGNCGILALDEPTTNLDQDNIDSLSEALTELINTKMERKDFQLILITHDDEFLKRLMNVEKLSYYYRVSRNSSGNSVIRKHRVNEYRNTN